MNAADNSLSIKCRLNGLDCSECAKKVENSMRRLPNVKSAEVDFNTKTAEILLNNSQGRPEVLSELDRISKELHNEVTVENIYQTETQVEVLIFEGLDCANCAEKIRTFASRIDGVKEVSLNLMNKKMKIEYAKEADLDYIFEEVKKITKRLEPDVIVHREKDSTEDSHFGSSVFFLENLDCANCGEKIKSKVGQLKGVKKVDLNFMAKKITIKYSDEITQRELLNEVTKISKSVEAGINVSLDGKEKVSSNKSSAKRQIYQLAIGAVLFALGLILKPAHPYNLIIFLAAYLVSGGDVVLKALRNIIRGQIFDENFLMTIASLGAFAIGDYPESVGVMIFYKVGEIFQSYAVDKSRRSIENLMNIRPDHANLVTDSGSVSVSPAEVEIGAFILIKPGEKVPLDGVVVEGMSYLDTSALTGESVPREAVEGTEILAGFINKSGLLKVKVTKDFGDTTVSKILDLVQNASSNKAETENFITKFARYYTPAVVIAAACIAVVPPLVISGAVFSDWLYRALTFLVVSCPCALVLSIPMSFFGGIGGASKCGVMIKGGNYLEALNYAETVVFDKTGTLTQGEFEVVEIREQGASKEDLLKYAAYAENYSSHPIARSIIRAYNKPIDESKIEKQEEKFGKGVKVKVEGREVLVGNYDLMKGEGIDCEEIGSTGTVGYVALDGVYAGALMIQDEVRPDSKQAITELKKLGIKNTVMLTGDVSNVAESVAANLGIDRVYSNMLPDQKVEQVEKLMTELSPKGKLIFVGDGINDAAVLSRADVGVAMGGLGSDAAIEAADVVIMTDEPSKIATAIKISKRTRKIVVENIILALGVKAIVLILAAFGLSTMWEAVFADVGVSVLAILNSMKALNVSKINSVEK